MRTTKYGIMLPNGGLARIKIENYEYTLCSDEAYPVWTVDSPEKLAPVLFSNTSVYSSSVSLPSWGYFDIEEMHPVQIVTEITKIELKLPANLVTMEIRHVPYSIAKLYAGCDLERKQYTCVVSHQAKVEFAPLIGQKVCFDNFDRQYILLSASEALEDYVDPDVEKTCSDGIKRKPRSILICEELK